MALGVTMKQATLAHGGHKREGKGTVRAKVGRQEDRLKELLDLCVRHVTGGQYWKGKVGAKYGRFTMGVRFSFIPQEEIFGALVKSLGNREKTAFSIKLQTWELYSMAQFPT